MKFIIYRESVAYSPPDNPPTTFKPLTHQSVGGDRSYTEWTIQIDDLAELQTLANHERNLLSAGSSSECGVRLEIKFPDKYGGVICILDKNVHDYRGRK